LKRTSLFDFHQRHAKLADFAGFEMPLWYSSVSEEHLAVRNRVGVFDVSHMGRVLLHGPDADKLLENLLPTTASTQVAGKSFYTLLLDEKAGIVDDLIVLKYGSNDYMLVVNAANKDKDIKHMQDRASGSSVELRDITADSTMIAIQGPQAEQNLQPMTPLDLDQLKRFRCSITSVLGQKSTITRTGYTGEDGFEVILHDSGVSNPEGGVRTWVELAGSAKPCGLGARDSLRIEAGYPLYGSDITEDTSPVEADLAWVVSKAKDGYVGSPILRRLMDKTPNKIRRGLVLNEQIPRSGFEILDQTGNHIGEVTSGTFSPILKKGIAMGYVNSEFSGPGTSVRVRVRDSDVGALITRPPFYDEAIYGWKRTKRK
jgi:aminomethyltransferase